ncbi:2-succinyl-5-enolpyruvyl-6-hydroxy-3-cyclohexene-1-carboxylic-acid synthase [Spirosoma taeanense]|uniref:2-succinyl-5-enolpyruvyl-6-hydroxy-3-cyclohexene-1-carboxylate synthase n=1 Tax=Spirosoma taeanense TaxID=2735870 RepID=A0A6M5YAZ6_9BACT|nr:2-succinyl-5-enolpyruvyl-6-hydroxy-3-cyclohexene-1-carboxylic-acid synthase [Spirosoma taeanense]QJW90052.1 2-succinyl-5-enolpyruvyl-6-hydroxy-3-cyclohexene-1-carboxylic-acid synthase [Spirosoma taeanense]
MPILQPIVDLAEMLVQKGITDVLVSPGSRSAPLTLAVARHPRLRVRVMADERSAGFVALGLAQQSGRPVAVICTSGSAVYNLAPAVAEAFFQHIPLLLLTADRPHEWLHQQDGQTMDQIGVFGPQVKRSYDLPADYQHADARWFIERSVNEAIHLSQLAPAGPVHINVPLREPFYPAADESFQFGPVRVIETLSTQPTLSPDTWHTLLDEWDQTERILIAVGQLPRDPALSQLLRQISEEFSVPIVGEIVSNLAHNGQFITHTDTFLSGLSADRGRQLRPDLLITLGGSFLTRNLKTFFRAYPALRHWHIQPSIDRITDSFQSLTTLIPAESLAFLQKLFADLDYQRFLQGAEDEDAGAYLRQWQTADQQAARLIHQTLDAVNQPLTDWSAVQQVLDQLPENSILHLANSMPIRYANLCGLDERQGIQVSVNRGVSGIDGCLSTAVGAALATERIVTLLIGDVAFFYDRNALWSAPVPANLRIVLLNNDSGHIFRLIDGPGRQPELVTYFETPHGYTARNTASDARLVYEHCDSIETLTSLLPDFFQVSEQAKLIEITTDKLVNQRQFSTYKAALNVHYAESDQ